MDVKDEARQRAEAVPENSRTWYAQPGAMNFYVVFSDDGELHATVDETGLKIQGLHPGDGHLVSEAFAEYIAAMDPATTLALLRELEAAERRELKLKATIEIGAQWLEEMSSADGSGHGDLAKRLREMRDAALARREGEVPHDAA